MAERASVDTQVELTDDGVLGKTVRHAIQHLDTFSKPAGVSRVILTTDEGTSLCPKTDQPDTWSCEIDYQPKNKCLESKSLKLYIWRFRNAGAFCEELAARIAFDVMKHVEPTSVKVTIKQALRGGIAIYSIAELHE